MNKSLRIFIMLIAGYGIIHVGEFRGKLKELTAPRIDSSVLNESIISVSEQRQVLVDYNVKICKAFMECSEATKKLNSSLIVESCNQSAKSILKINIPYQLPIAVKKNLQIYQQSMVNSSKKIADRWEDTNTEGGSFWTFIINWEIDTCGPRSIPQKIYQLYKLDEFSNTKIITCKEIEELYKKGSVN